VDWFFPRLVREFCNDNQTTTIMFSPAYFFYLPSAVILYSPTASGAEQVSKTNHLIETLLLEEFPVVGSEPVGYDKRGRRYELQ